MKINKKSPFRYLGRLVLDRSVLAFRLLFAFRKGWRWLHIQKPVTALLGFQYKVADDLIEIDLTYQCNLKCNNCNRSSAQAPEAVHIKLSVIKDFVEQSLVQKRYWQRIRILGGEPTLHPDFLAIIDQLLLLKKNCPDTVIQVVSNGYGRKVEAMLAKLPESIQVENSAKSSNIQPAFGPFNLAPQDSWQYRFADYRNGCGIAGAGIGLTPQGYYQCTVAGGIDRVKGVNGGRKSLPDSRDGMRDLMNQACRLCGHFRDGHYVPEILRPSLLEQRISPSWENIYREWRARKLRTPAVSADEEKSMHR
ncbi:radical SAM protein [Photobacterium sagamiensis]|uniref:radical SAM protein n=1 Tax=Photobacterium sagamiensis TaxID=2910241 RepID=UPI003D119208